MSDNVLWYGTLAPLSKSAIVCFATRARSARSDCDQLRSARAALHWSGVIDISVITLIISIDVMESRGQYNCITSLQKQ